jgi:hypothetical protein
VVPKHVEKPIPKYEPVKPIHVNPPKPKEKGPKEKGPKEKGKSF